MAYYVDVHTHLTHADFATDLPEVIKRANQAGLKAIVVNGLGPKSNREILELSKTYSIIKAALGIYPIEAVNEILPADYKFTCEKFSTKAEIAFIEKMALDKKISAVGECGLDAYHLEEETFAKQEEVFSSLIAVAKKTELPIIVHSRKREERVIAMLAEHKLSKVNMHCYSGKIKSAVQAAEKFQWCFSIPANVKRSHSFQTLVKKLPPECILTETDAPYLGPEPGFRNEPANVVGTVRAISELRAWEFDFTLAKITENYERLFKN